VWWSILDGPRERFVYLLVLSSIVVVAGGKHFKGLKITDVVKVTGTISPDATGYYERVGTYNNRPRYRRLDGQWVYFGGMKRTGESLLHPHCHYLALTGIKVIGKCLATTAQMVVLLGQQLFQRSKYEKIRSYFDFGFYVQ
jgi:hypothetical protein